MIHVYHFSKATFYLALILAVVLQLASPGVILASSWGPAGCGPVVAGYGLVPGHSYSSPGVYDSYRWQKSQDSDEWFLYKNNWWVGNFRGGKYYPYNGVNWLAPTNPPVAPPVNSVQQRKQIEQLPDWALDGVKWDLVKKSCERYTIDGNEISKRQAFDLVGDDLSDESKKPWIVVVVDEDRSVMLDKLKEFTNYRIQVYKPDDWEVSDRKLKQGLTVMLPDGTLLLDGVSFNLDVLRRLNPFKPNPEPLPLPFPVNNKTLVWLVAFGSFLVWLFVMWKVK